MVSAAVETTLGSYGTTHRLAGANRYATAAEISKARFSPASTDTAYVATGVNFPDALAGGPAAAVDGAPILLVTKDSIPNPTAVELTRLGVSTIVILGGTGVVSAAAETQLGAYATTVLRRAGTNRYNTAVEISRSKFSPGVPRIYVATGENFPDALAGAAAAGFVGGPILLLTRYSVPGSTAGEIARLTGMPCGAFNTAPRTFGSGTWVVGAEIPPGTYRNDDSSALCYAARLSGFGGTLGEIITNELSTTILAVTIEPGDVGFESTDCGTWSNDIRYRPGPTSAPFGSGTWFVNQEVAPGTWRNDDSSQGCYWERKSGFSWHLADIIANEFTFNISTVTISGTDQGFYSWDCGTWTKIG